MQSNPQSPVEYLINFYKRHDRKIKFVIVGSWNTLFGYIAFIALYLLLKNILHYVLILIISYIVSVSNAYSGYKFLVFKTKSNYLREYLRFYLVYVFVFIINAALLAFATEILKKNLIVSQTFIVAIVAIFSYIGHRNFTFYQHGAKQEGKEENQPWSIDQ